MSIVVIKVIYKVNTVNTDRNSAQLCQTVVSSKIAKCRNIDLQRHFCCKQLISFWFGK